MLQDRLFDSAQIARTVTIGQKIDGEADETEQLSEAFQCGLFLPGATEIDGPSGRRATRNPTLLCAAAHDDGSPLELRAADEVLVTSAAFNVTVGLIAGSTTRWQVQGSPQPMVRPGDAPFGFNVTVARVED